MNPVIEHMILPLVGSIGFVSTDMSFNPNEISHCHSLEILFSNYIKNKNKEELKQTLAFFIQQWPSIDQCPIDRNMIKNAVEILKEDL